MARTRIAVVALLALSVAHGIVSWLAQQGKLPALTVALTLIAISVLSMIWAQLDARERGYPIEGWLLALVFLLPIVGMPVYFYKHRDATSRRKSIHVSWAL